MHIAKAFFVCFVFILQPVYIFADSAKKTNWDNLKFKMEKCPNGANRNSDRPSKSYSLGSMQGWKIDVLDEFADPSGQWNDWIVIGVSKSKNDQKICQSVSVNTIAESRKPKLKIEKDTLVISQTTNDRYSPNSFEETTTYHLDKNGKFEILSNNVVNPFDEFKKQFEFALKGSDLHALLSLRDKYITILASSYNPGSYNEERRSLCFRSLEAATKLATKDVEVLKTVFTQFFDEPSDESDSLNSCGKTFSPPAKQILPIQPKQEESATDDDTEATVQLTEECDSSTWQDCKPLSKSEILILNNAAFLLQKMGQHTEAIKLLRYVLKQDPQRKVAYKNLGDSLAAQKKSGSSLALIAASVVKRNPKILSSAEVRSIAEQIGATCERSETMTSSISDRLNVTEFEFRCQPLGAKDDLGSLRARWDYNLDDVVIIKTLEDKKSSKNDPVSGVVNQKQLKSSK